MTGPSFAPILALVGAAGLFVAACRDDAPCSLSSCDVEHGACHAEVFDVIACAREFHGEPPPVEVIGPGEHDERFVEEPQDATARLRDQQVTELLRALQLETRALPDHPRPIAFYSLDSEQVIVVTTNAFDDETRVFVLMQAFANAQQAQELDLRFLLREQPTTDAAIAAATLIHGEAHFSANLGMQLRRTGIELDPALGFYSELRSQALAVASDPSTPHAFAIEDFIYGYGGHMAAERWDAEGREGLGELLRAPPRSTFAILQQQTPGSSEEEMIEITMIPRTNALVERIRAALERLRPAKGVVHVSVANDLKWEKSPGRQDEVLVRWLCWSIDDGDEEIAPPEFEVVGKEVTGQRLARELPLLLPGVTVAVDDDIEI